MIDRYTRPEMAAIWTERAKLDTWLEIEILACEAMAAQGLIPEADAHAIRARATYDLATVQKNEERTQHDVLAFLEDVAARVGPAGRWIHQGLTSSDILDTAFAVQLTHSCDLLLQDLDLLLDAIKNKALEHMLTPMIGRSHGIHAEPITYGYKLASMLEEFRRARRRLELARQEIAVGKISGAVGTYAHLPPQIERHVCEKLGLQPDPISTQIIARDRHAALMQTWALIATNIDRWATEFRHLQRTEVLEVEEYFAPGQKGSSAMPHKRNPITAERLSGLARLIRGHAITALENVPLWHERDISHSSAERIIFPDAATALDYMLAKLTDLVQRQIIYPEHMQKNLALTRGLYASQTLLLELTRRGLPRQTAYEAVQEAAMACWQSQSADFVTFAQAQPTLASHLTPEEIRAACSLEKHLAHIPEKFKALGISP
jgi:adenylosuccinate lyase